MEPIRFRLHAVMTGVVIVALNLGVGRTLLSSRDPATRFEVETLFGGGMIWVMVQVAAARAYRSRGRARAFWLGFSGGGAFGAIPIGLDRCQGRWFPASILSDLWRIYQGAIFPWTDRVLRMLDRNNTFNIWCPYGCDFVDVMMNWFFPAMLAAVAAGVLVRTLSRPSGRNPKFVTGPAGS